MKKHIILLLALSLTLIACGGPDQTSSNAFTSLAPFDAGGLKIGVPTGAKSDAVATERFPDCEIVHYAHTGDGFVALKTEKIDGFCFTRNTMQYVVNQNPDLVLLPEVIADNDLAIGARLGEDALMAEVNAVIALFHENGIRAEMEQRWLGTDLNPVMPEIAAPVAPTRTVIVGLDNADIPMAYMETDGSASGFDAEYALRLGQELNWAIEFAPMEWPALIPALQSGRIDLIISNLNITEERQLSLLLSDVYVTTDIVMMVRASEDAAAQQDGDDIFRPEDFAGKTFAVITGSIWDSILAEYIPDATPVYFNGYTESVMALRQGRVDATFTSIALSPRFSAMYPDLKVLHPPVQEVECAFVFGKDKTLLRESFNAFLQELEADGTYADMEMRWMQNVESPPMPEIPTSGENGRLLFATTGTADVFSFIQDGSPAGFEVELAYRFAGHMGMELEVQLMDFAALIPAVQAGKADFSGNNFAVTAERAQSVDFSDMVYMEGNIVAVRQDMVIEAPSFMESLKTAIDRNLIQEDRWKLLADGLGVSMIITIFSFILATVMGFLVCGLRMSKNRILSSIGRLYVMILRGTPIVVLLMITFYVIFAKSNISGVSVAIIAFGINTAAFIGEILRSAIQTVDKGQVEAARSMGFSKLGGFFSITFPQAVRVAFPVYMSEFISLFKMTAVVGYIAVVDLTKAGDIIRSRTYDAFFPLVFVALVYLLVASVMIGIFGRIERMTNKRLRRDKP